MINQHDIQALSELLRRTPMSAAEAIYASDLVARLAQQVQPPAEAAPPAEARPKRKPRRPKAPAAAPVEPPLAPLRPPPLAGW